MRKEGELLALININPNTIAMRGVDELLTLINIRAKTISMEK